MRKSQSRARALRDAFLSHSSDEELEEIFKVWAKPDVIKMINEVGEIENPIPLGTKMLKEIPEFRKLAGKAIKAVHGVEKLEKSVQRIRYPPFEHYDMIPEEIPIIEIILESENKPPPAFKIGSEDDWFVEWRKLNESDNSKKVLKGDVSKETFPFLMRTRNGWYIDPDPMHYRARKMIAPAVIILISTLFLRAITPVFSEVNFINPLLELLNYSVRIGELDYPIFLFVAFPIFISPMIFRMIANMRDIRRQNNLISDPIEAPDIDIIIGENEIDISMIKLPSSLNIVRGRIQVGIVFLKGK